MILSLSEFTSTIPPMIFLSLALGAIYAAAWMYEVYNVRAEMIRKSRQELEMMKRSSTEERRARMSKALGYLTIRKGGWALNMRTYLRKKLYIGQKPLIVSSEYRKGIEMAQKRTREDSDRV